MNRLMPALLALALGAPAGAAWVPFMQSDASVVYIDSASVRKEGHLRKAWVLVDLQQKDPSGAHSKRGHTEIDCHESRMRIHDLSGFAGRMASGESVYAFQGSSEWLPIPPNTLLWDRIRLVCSR
jgi:hypothetical protein